MFDSEFNPKGWSLLDEQLAESGLEMSIDPFTAISAGASIIGGIFGSSQASSANKSAKRAQKKAQELANKQAAITNAYNQEAFAAEKKDPYILSLVDQKGIFAMDLPRRGNKSLMFWIRLLPKRWTRKWYISRYEWSSGREFQCRFKHATNHTTRLPIIIWYRIC